VAWSDTPLSRLLGIRYPLIQAPMAGVNTPELVAAVSNAGGLGSLGGASLGPDSFREQLAAVHELSDEPFAVNLFAPLDTPEAPEAVAGMLARLAPYRDALGLGPGEAPPHPEPPFEIQLEVLLERPPPVFSFTFGIPPEGALDSLRDAGTTLIGTATTTAEAAAIEAAGCHAVVAQGSEAGGHRGTFAVEFDAALVGSMALVPQVADRVDIPVIAAGGIMDGRGIAAALALGAGGAQLGTVFIGADEAAAPEAYVSSLERSADSDTTVTRAFSGRHARALRSAWVDEVEGSGEEIPPYPVPAMLLAELRPLGFERDQLDAVMRLAGQAAPMIRRGPAAELVAAFVGETDAALRSVSPD
jgi:nitronate monooxygenase